MSQGLPCLFQKQAGFLQARLGEPTVTEMAVFQGQLAALGVHPVCQQRGILVRNISPGPQASCLHFLGHLSLVGGRHQRVGSRRGEGPAVIQCGVESSPPPGLKHLPETALPAPLVLQGLLQPQHFLGCRHRPWVVKVLGQTAGWAAGLRSCSGPPTGEWPPGQRLLPVTSSCSAKPPCPVLAPC